MRERPFGPTGRDVAVIGQGTWRIESGRGDAAVNALRRGLDLGMTHIDTAEMYGDGRSEEIIARAIEGRRQEVFLVSKVSPANASRQGTIEACERSLGRLRTDHLDCYLLHWPGPHPLEDTIAALAELVEGGKILSWGLSNFDERGLSHALDIAGSGGIACDQVLYHLGERAIEHAVLPFCRKHGIAVVGYSPFGGGRFPSPRSSGGRTLAEIAEARRASPEQVALAFLAREEPLFAIPKAGRIEHIQSNAAAGDLVLTPEEIAAIDRAFPPGPKPRSLPVG